MKQIIQLIEERSKEARKSPFIHWLEDDALPVRDRLSKWLQGAGIFVFGFSDLHLMVLPYPRREADSDAFKRAINEHAKEDSNHWGWYLSDLKKLGLDNQMKFDDVLRMLFDNKTYKQRFAIYRLCQLVERANGDPVLRYCVIKPIEAFGEIIFGTAARVSKEFEKETGIKLDYLGEVHAQRESGGLQHDENAEEAKFLSTELDATRRQVGMEIATEACDLMEKRWTEFYGWVNGS